jgi:hypothetical protein
MQCAYEGCTGDSPIPVEPGRQSLPTIQRPITIAVPLQPLDLSVLATGQAGCDRAPRSRNGGGSSHVSRCASIKCPRANCTPTLSTAFVGLAGCRVPRILGVLSPAHCSRITGTGNYPVLPENSGFVETSRSLLVACKSLRRRSNFEWSPLIDDFRTFEVRQ